MDMQKNIRIDKKGAFRRLGLLMALLLSSLFAAGCLSSYRTVRDINQLPADRSATIQVVVNTTKDGKILQEEIEKDYWRLPGGPYRPYPILNYEWYLWLAMDHESYPLIPKGRTFIKNVPLIHEGDAANLTRDYPVPAGEHRFWLEFAGLRPYVYAGGSSSDMSLASGDGNEDGGDWEGHTRLGLIWTDCFSANLQPGQVITVTIDNNGVHLPKEVKAEAVSNCHNWLIGGPVEAWKRILP